MLTGTRGAVLPCIITCHGARRDGRGGHARVSSLSHGKPRVAPFSEQAGSGNRGERTVRGRGGNGVGSPVFQQQPLRASLREVVV